MSSPPITLPPPAQQELPFQKASTVDQLELLIRRAANAVYFSGEEEAATLLVKDGIDPATAFLAVKAGQILASTDSDS